MNDQYQITETHADEAPRGALRPALWFALLLSIGGNVVASTVLGNSVVGSAFGVAAAVCATVLIVHHYRNRAR